MCWGSRARLFLQSEAGKRCLSLRQYISENEQAFSLMGLALDFVALRRKGEKPVYAILAKRGKNYESKSIDL